VHILSPYRDFAHWGACGAHPFILLNYEDTMGNMFTLAHELGHAMHHYYSQEQHNAYADYTIFSAEIASTVNETILTEHMIQNTTDKNTRIHLLDEYIRRFNGIIFEQVMYAEFEMIVHKMAEDGEPLTPESISEVFLSLYKKYNGPDYATDEYTGIEWASVPHFWMTFYVYQYATGYAAAVAFNKRIKSGDPKVLEDYIGFLKAGDSDYTINILKKAGVDMSTPAPIREALTVYEGLISELESCF